MVGDVEPGSIVYYGTDDDMTCLVVANYRTTRYRHSAGGGLEAFQAPTLLLYGCMGEPGEWGQGRLFEATLGELDTVSIFMEPEALSVRR